MPMPERAVVATYNRRWQQRGPHSALIDRTRTKIRGPEKLNARHLTAMETVPDVDPKRFRDILGRYPTGVTVVTAIGEDGRPAGLAVGSFTSVSLDPLLVAFLPDRNSSTFGKMRSAGSFCVNVLAADQEPVCRAFAAKGDDKFSGIEWKPAPSGAPRLADIIAWIDCDVHAIHEAGDHFIVIGRVRDLELVLDKAPLLFHRGGYGSIAGLKHPA